MNYHFIIILFIINIFHITNIYAQSTIYNFNNICQIELPNKLELQSSELNTVTSSSSQQGKKNIRVNSPVTELFFNKKV